MHCPRQDSRYEARRLLIARALVHDPRFLLLDEPTTGLDLLARQRFLETLRVLARSGKTLLLVTHHIEEILPEVDQVFCSKRDGYTATVAGDAHATVQTSP